jgi:hypothetical protein
MRAGERQVAPDLTGIRRDHLARYEWAAKYIRETFGSCARVVDCACGVGYGAFILAEANLRVFAIDKSEEAIAYAKKHYGHKNITYLVGDANNLGHLQPCDVAITFETIEHLEHPAPFLRTLASSAPVLLASVPNEEVFPWQNIRFHFRHYTRQQFADLLEQCGFGIEEWFGQEGQHSEVAKNINGRTAIVVAKRQPAGRVKKRKPQAPKAQAVSPKKFNVSIDGVFTTVPERQVPERVAILGLGPSLNTFVGIVKRLGSRKRLCDEVWGLNAVLDLIKCDRGLHMDDIRIQQIRADADPSGNIAAMLPWLKTIDIPVYTSRPHPDYPNLVAYPLAEVLNNCSGERYFNSTAAYAVALAVSMGVKKIILAGCDF